MSGTTPPPITAIPALVNASALNQGMIAPANPLAQADQTPTGVTYRFLDSLWRGEQQIWAQIQSFQSTLQSMLAMIHAPVGVTDGSDAPAGAIGEYHTASASGGLANATPTDMVTLTLQAGDWDVMGSAFFNPSGGLMTVAEAWIGTAAATPQDPQRMLISGSGSGVGTLTFIGGVVGPVRYSFAAPATQTVRLGCQTNFPSGASVTVSAWIRARRVR